MNIKSILSLGLVSLSLGLSACSDVLDLQPIDYPNTTNFWDSPNKVVPYMNGVHLNLRSFALTHTIVFGELRSGIYQIGAGADGSNLSSPEIVSQQLSEDRPGVQNMGGYFGAIQNLNLFIERIETLEYPEAAKKYFLGQAHGIRAFYYFDLYRTYGTVPVQLTPDVVNGERDPNKLRKDRAKAAVVLAQIKSDIQKSEDYFGTEKRFDLYGVGGQKSAWSKAATETLKGEVYLWSAKTAVLDQPAQPQDLSTAKTALLSVLNNYNLSLMSNFSELFDVNHKGNSEVIFAARLRDGEATNGYVRNYLYRSNNGTVRNLFTADGKVFGDALETKGNGMLVYQYKNELYQSFDAQDTRRDATFFPAYRDRAATALAVALVKKSMGEINAQGNRVYTSDVLYYRLADVVLMLAEVANMEGNNADVERYMNMIRTRAYGANASSHLFTASDFKTNELAILLERTKEFVQEGKRWYDLRRMLTDRTNGMALVFSTEANIDGSTTPLLDPKTEAYKVLWPINRSLIDNDGLVKQTEGYSTKVLTE